MSESGRVLTPDEEWTSWHRAWMNGEIATDSLLAYAIIHKEAPAAWVWALTVIGLRCQKPSSMVVISNV